MSKLINKLEKKWGRKAIPNLINYMLVLYAAGTIMGLFAPNLYTAHLALNWERILHGQIWRIFTFMLTPYPLKGIIRILFFAITIHLYYLFGTNLEREWGTFKFNVFVFGGILLTLLTNLACYLLLGVSDYTGGLNYIYQSMFFAFCLLNPDLEFRLYFLIPIKSKWLALLDGIMMVADMVGYMRYGKYGMPYALAIVAAFINLAVIYHVVTGYSVADRIKQMRRKNEFRKNMAAGGYGAGAAKPPVSGSGRSTAEAHKNAVFNRSRQNGTENAEKTEPVRTQPAQPVSGETQQPSKPMRTRSTSMHRCAICGRTEVTNPDLKFRFCTKCVGSYEYCDEHLFTHRHMGY